MYAHGARLAAQDIVCNEILACDVRGNNGANLRLRYVLIIGQQLLGVLGQAVATVAEARVVVVAADAWIEAHTFDDLSGIQAMGRGVGIKLIEEGDSHS